MIMLYAVRMRFVFISSVTAMTPLRTISVRTASAFPRLGFTRVSSLLRYPDCRSRRRVLLDQRRAVDAIARAQRIAHVNRCLERPIGLGEVNPAPRAWARSAA